MAKNLHECTSPFGCDESISDWPNGGRTSAIERQPERSTLLAVMPLDAAPAPQLAPLTDPFGRAITYLRVRVTDRCDLRCAYLPWRFHDRSPPDAASGAAHERRGG